MGTKLTLVSKWKRDPSNKEKTFKNRSILSKVIIKKINSLFKNPKKIVEKVEKKNKLMKTNKKFENSSLRCIRSGVSESLYEI